MHLKKKIINRYKDDHKEEQPGAQEPPAPGFQPPATGAPPEQTGGAQMAQPQGVAAQTATVAAEPDSSAHRYEQLRNYNASSEYVKFTSEVFPHLQMSSSVHFPLGVFTKPLGQVGELPLLNLIPPKEKPTDRVDIPRCDVCRAYVNPFFEFLEGGRKFRCNICDAINNVPPTYFKPLDQNGLRVNFDSSPELFTGSVEFLANEDYASRLPKDPTYFFVIDISKSSCNALVPTYTLAAIKELLRSNRLNGEKNACFGIAFIDTQLHLLQLRNKSPTLVTLDPTTTQPYRLPADRFLIFLDFLTPQEIDTILDGLIPVTGFSNHEMSLQCLEDGLKYVTELMASQGGKLSLILGGEESFPPKIPEGDQSKRSYFNANDQAIARAASEMHKWLIAMDLYVFGQNRYKNLASLAEGIRMGGGESCYYTGITQTDLTRFYNELIFNCSKPMTWESVFRLRCNSGWRKRAIGNQYGSVGNDLLRPEQVDENYSVLFLFEDESKTAEKKGRAGKDLFYIQTSLLYTNAKRQRTIRVHNYCIPLTNQLKKTYEALDYQATSAALLRISMQDFPENKPLGDMQIDLANHMKKMFSGISMNTSSEFQAEVLPYLTVAFLGILKSDVLLAKYVNNCNLISQKQRR